MALLTGPEPHQGVRLDDEDRERLVTWMDLYAQKLGSFSPAQEANLRELRRACADLFTKAKDTLANARETTPE
jgi:hypothetical protein